MDTPIPTPFDIIDPAPGAVVPTGMAWLILLVLVGLALAAIAVYRRTPRGRSVHRTLHALLDEVRRLCSQPSAQRNTQRITRLTRRLASAYCGIDTGALSCAELRALAQEIGSRTDESAHSLSSIVALLAHLEEQAYAPHHATAPQASSDDTLVTLVQTLETHVRRFRPL